MDNPGATLYRWDDLPIEPLNPLLGRRLISGERLMLSHVYFEPGGSVPWHAHDNEQLTYILEGSMHFWFDGNESDPVMIRAGEVLHIPSQLSHRAVALERTLDVDVFAPPRQDWLDGSDDYLRGR